MRSAAGDHERARQTLGRLEAASLVTPYLRARVCLVRAEVLLGTRDLESAREAAEDAVDLFSGCSAPYETARARLVLAGALEAAGRTERASAEADAARHALQTLGARHDDRAGDTTTGPLSPREVDILRLVAQGCSDAQVAERLFLSPHTVHRHVANVRRKLGASSRAAAVANATRLRLL